MDEGFIGIESLYYILYNTVPVAIAISHRNRIDRNDTAATFINGGAAR